MGEYGSVIFIAGNMPMVSEITPLLIIIQAGAVRLRRRHGHGVVMLVAAFVLLLVINALQGLAAQAAPELESMMA
jgi:sulfate transport system permease protein